MARNDQLDVVPITTFDRGWALVLRVHVPHVDAIKIGGVLDGVVGEFVANGAYAQVHDLLFFFVFPMKIDGLGKFRQDQFNVKLNGTVFKDPILEYYLPRIGCKLHAFLAFVVYKVHFSGLEGPFFGAERDAEIHNLAWCDFGFTFAFLRKGKAL